MTETPPPPVPPVRERTHSTGDLIGEALTHVSSLLRNELDLARAEIDRSMTRAAIGVGFLVAAVVILICALNVLTAALVGAVAAALESASLPGVWAAIIVGVLYVIVAWILVKSGMNKLKASSLAPRRTASNLKKDAELLRGTL